MINLDNYLYLNKVVKLDKDIMIANPPTLRLMTRSFKMLGKISKFENWNISIVGNGLDEISFTVDKYVDGVKCPIWDDLMDLKVVDVNNVARFEIDVQYTDNTRTTKSVHGVSLETELGQKILEEFHVNDDEAMEGKTEFKPTVFCDFEDPKHSLLHRVLSEAPHWTLDEVTITKFISFSEDENAEHIKEFQRTYTVNGTSIYDFLTGEVAEQSNVVFLFDTVNRKITCRSLIDCYIDGEKLEDGIGEDTTILVSKNKLANDIQISSDKDSVKNCFRIVGGDDTISDMVRAANINGSNKIYLFSDFQLNDMSQELRDGIQAYQEKLAENQDRYHGENGIYTRLVNAYKELAYLESEMMPTIDTNPPESAEVQYNLLKDELENMVVGVSSTNNYTDSLFTGVTNNIEAIANILIDSRYELDIIKIPDEYPEYQPYYHCEDCGYEQYDKMEKCPNCSSENISDFGTWTGIIQITRVSDKTDFYPKQNDDGDYTETITVKVADDKSDPSLPFTKQKIDIALAKGDMSSVDYDASQLATYEDKVEYFNQFCLNRLKSFKDGYDSCISVLASGDVDSDIKDELMDEYNSRQDAVIEVLEIRQEEVENVKLNILSLEQKQEEFQKEMNFQTFLGDELYTEFCCYCREDTYTNSNYISDGKESVSDLLNIAKELIDNAEKELRKACVLQRTVSTSLGNLLMLPEFAPLYDSFNMYNYIRIRTEDEIIKVRLIGVDFSGDSISDINVTFADQIETVDGKISEVQSILQQASAIATSYNSTILQAKKGVEANKEVNDIYTNGLSATKAMITNSDDNEITITPAGINAKRMDDVGVYGDKQLRIIGNGIYLTDDAWKSLKMAVGEVIYTNPINGESEQKYGIIAETLIGQLIAGNQIHIGNEDGSVLIDGKGITIKNGLIQSANYEENVSGSMLDLTNGTFNYAGGNLIYNETDGLIVKGSGTFSGTVSGGDININNNFIVDSNGNVTSNGDASFASGDFVYNSSTDKLTVTGDIIATTLTATQSGKIANFNFDTSALYTDGATWSNNTGIYLGFNGLRLGSGFKVDSNGSMICDDASISGSITAETLKVWDEIQLMDVKSGFIGQYRTVLKFGSGNSFNPIIIGDGGNIEFNTGNGIFSGNINVTQNASIGTQLTVPSIYSNNIDSKIKCVDGTQRVPTGTSDTTYSVAYINSKAQNASGNYYITVNALWEGISYASHNIVSSSSDIRLKENIKDTDINNALDFISKIKVRQFDWKHNKCHQKIGFIANELEELDLALSVGGGYEEDGSVNYKTVDSFYLQGYEVKAIQELYHKIQQQQAEIDRLKQSISVLTEQMEDN